MDELMLLTDGSVNTRSSIGYGAYLVVSAHELSAASLNRLPASAGMTIAAGKRPAEDSEPRGINPEERLKARIKTRRFENTSSTRLELQTVLWALNDIQASGGKVIVYTDSQNIMGLPARRDRFEQGDYRSRKNQRVNNYELYQEFYRITDLLDCEFVKVRGHRVSNQKDDIDRLFTLVDRASRNALRKNNE